MRKGRVGELEGGDEEKEGRVELWVGKVEGWRERRTKDG